MHRVTGGDPLLFEIRENVLNAYRQLRDNHPAFPEDLRNYEIPNSYEIPVPMKLFKHDQTRGFQNIIDFGQIYGIITNNEYLTVLSCK